MISLKGDTIEEFNDELEADTIEQFNDQPEGGHN